MNKKKSEYQKGIKWANHVITMAINDYGESAGRKKIAELHEQIDKRMFEGIARGDDISYLQGLAMGLGMYANTKMRLKE